MRFKSSFLPPKFLSFMYHSVTKYDYKYTNATYIINENTNSTQENPLNDEPPCLN